MGRQPHSRRQRLVNRHKTRLMKARNYRQENGRDLDEVHDLKKLLPEGQTIDLPINEDLPGLGQFHCVECG
jgi:agmatine/peptidylarginine deiminase